MPWCPKCGNEYRPEFEACADCGEPLVVDGPEEPARQREPSEFVVVVYLVCSVVLVVVTYLTAWTATMLFHGSGIPEAVSIGVLCLGGILFSLLQPRPRLGLSFILWAAPPTLLSAAMIVCMVIASDFELRDLFVWDAVGGVGYLLAWSGIGAVTATIAGRWFCGQGHKYALALLATVVAFVSTPLAVHWLAVQLYG